MKTSCFSGPAAISVYYQINLSDVKKAAADGCLQDSLSLTPYLVFSTHCRKTNICDGVMEDGAVALSVK